MRNMFYSLLIAMIMSVVTFSVSGADSGAVNEGLQVWEGKKVFLDNSPVSTTATGHLTLYKDSKRIQLIDANGSARNVTLPVETITQGWEFYIVNTSSGANALTIKGSAGGTVGTVNQYQSCYAWCNGTTWYTYVFTSTATGFVAADGTTVGATGQTQVFTNGVTADTFIGNTATAMTVTAKAGATNTVGNAVAIAGGAGNGAFDGGAVSITGGASGAGATGNGGAVTILGKVATSTNGDGGLASVTGGAGVGSGAGGLTKLLSGAGGATGAGGAATVTGGRGGSTSGAAGVATITAGAGGAATTTTGGIASINGGGSGTGATGNGGKVQCIAGAALSTNGSGGAAELTGGVSTGTGTGGAVTITSGASVAAGGTAGSITIDAGDEGTGTRGTITIGGTEAGAIQVGRTGQTVTFPGTVAMSVTPTGDGIAMYKEVAITNAQMLDLADTPVELIAAAGVGKVIEVVSVSFYFDYVGAYTVTANDDLDVCYGTESNVIMTAEATGFVDATADTALFGSRVASYAPAKTACDNAAVVLANNSSDFGGGNAGNEVTVKINYRIWTTGW